MKHRSGLFATLGLALAAVPQALWAGPAPVVPAIPSPQDCAALPAQDELACLRAALEASHDALSRAGQSVSSPAQAVAPVSSAPGSAPSASELTAEPAADLGAEQLARTQGATSRNEALQAQPGVQAGITDSSVDHLGRLIVRLDNGQAWQQVEPSAVPLRIGVADGPRVEITRSGFGGYRMKVPQSGRRIAVRRID